MTGRRLAALGLTAALSLAAASAVAAPRPRWADVPEGSLPAALARSEAPDSVDAAQHMPGITVSRAGDVNRPWASITTSDRRCLRVDDGLTEHDHDREPVRTSGLLRLPRPAALRSERIVGEGAAARLEIVDAWTDARSLGAKVVATTSIPLAPLARDPHGARVYAFRHGDVLEIVVPVTRAATLTDAEGDASFVDCAHARLALPVRAEGSTALLVLQPDPPPFARPPASGPAEGTTTVGASVSRMTRDRSPVLSVTLDWMPPEPAIGPADPAAFLPR